MAFGKFRSFVVKPRAVYRKPAAKAWKKRNVAFEYGRRNTSVRGKPSPWKAASAIQKAFRRRRAA